MKAISRTDTVMLSSDGIDDRRSLDLEESSEEIIQIKTVTSIDNVRYRWASKGDFMTSTMACIFSVNAFDVFIQAQTAEPGVYHYAIMFAFLGLPIYYMQLLLGQYTQLGIIFLKYLSPIAHGVALIFIVNLFLRTIRQSMILDDAIVLFITSMQSQLPWLMCPPQNNIPCYDGAENCSNLFCGNRTVYLPAFIFYNYHFLGNPVRDSAKMSLVMPTFQKIAIHGICWFLICVILICTINHYMKVIRILRRTTLVLLFVLMSVTTLPDLATSIPNLFAIKTETFTNLQSWLTAMSVTMELLALGRAFHVVHGSYLSMNEPCAKYASVIVLLHFILIISCSLFTTTCINSVAKYANVDKDYLSLIFYHGRETLFVVIPQAIGSMGIPQMWSCIYFAIIILINISLQLAHLTFIQMSLSDIYPELLRYKKYGVILFSLCSGFVSCLLIAPESFVIYIAIVKTMPNDAAIVDVILMTFFVCWIYGVQRFSDDIHFITGQQPAKPWRICWYIIPLVLILSYARLKIDYYKNSSVHSKEKILHISLLMLLISPLPIVAIIETFRFIKARNLIALFQPDERFGSPDPNERELRRMFNPRTETKSRRRMQVCKHRCLLGSKPLMTITKAKPDSLADAGNYNSVTSYEELG